MRLHHHAQFAIATIDMPARPVSLQARYTLCLACVLVPGCVSVGPDYVPPRIAVPAQWASFGASDLGVDGADSALLTAWWDAFGDPLLSSLMLRARTGNRDLAQAEARIREARARRGIAQAERLPTVQSSAAATQRSSSEEAGSGTTTRQYAAGFDANWELDLFGGRRRALEAASANLEASAYDLRDVLVSLCGEVALNYIDLRTFQARLAVAQSNLQAQSETHDIARWRQQAGLATQRDVEQARLNLEQTRALIPALQTGIAQSAHHIAVLLGQHPGTLQATLTPTRPIPVAPATVAIGVPAETLRRRPDVQRAERQLAAQTAQIGVATAALYPNFSLAGSIGLESLLARRLITASAVTSSLGASMGWTMFDAGRVRQNIAVQTALQEQALGRYEAAVLTALQDVENALTAHAAEQQRHAALTVAADAARNAATLAQQQYAAGLVDFQIVLDAQRSLLSLQDQLAASQGTVAANLVRLYKALGGGWTALAQKADVAK